MEHRNSRHHLEMDCKEDNISILVIPKKISKRNWRPIFCKVIGELEAHIAYMQDMISGRIKDACTGTRSKRIISSIRNDNQLSLYNDYKSDAGLERRMKARQFEIQLCQEVTRNYSALYWDSIEERNWIKEQDRFMFEQRGLT